MAIQLFVAIKRTQGNTIYRNSITNKYMLNRGCKTFSGFRQTLLPVVWAGFSCFSSGLLICYKDSKAPCLTEILSEMLSLLDLYITLIPGILLLALLSLAPIFVTVHPAFGQNAKGNLIKVEALMIKLEIRSI